MLSIFITLLSFQFIIWTLLLIPIQLVGLRIRKIHGPITNIFMTKIRYAALWSNDEPESWICGYGFIGYASRDDKHSNVLYICCTDYLYKRYLPNKLNNQHIRYVELDVYMNTANVRLRPIKVTPKIAKPQQQSTITQILDLYRTQQHVTCLIHGKPGSMKSMTAQLLCKDLLNEYGDVTLINTYDPTSSIISFLSIYNRIDPSTNKPMVMIFEEADYIIDHINSSKKNVDKVTGYQPLISDKRTWNKFFDDVHEDLINNIIILMTTNKPLEYFNDIDSAFLREGRVDIISHYG